VGTKKNEQTEYNDPRPDFIDIRSKKLIKKIDVPGCKYI
jgi:hypothetical protein